MKVKFLYSRNDKKNVDSFTGRMLEFDPSIEIVKRYNTQDKVKLVLVASDQYNLKSLISKIEPDKNFAILTFNIQTDFILKCLKFSKTICYAKGNIELILKKIRNLD